MFVDLETRESSPWHPDARILGVAVKLPGSAPEYWPISHPDSPSLPLSVLTDLCRTMCEAGVGLTNHNRRFDIKFACVLAGAPQVEAGRDSMIAMQLVQENQLGPSGTFLGAFALKHRAAQRFGAEAVSAEQGLVKFCLEHGLHPKRDLYKLPAAIVAPYACSDVVLVERCFTDWLDPEIERLGLVELLAEYSRYDALLTQLEIHGMLLDRELVQRYLDEAECKSAQLSEEIARRAGQVLGIPPANVNPGSPVQMRTWLGLPSTEAWRLRALKSHADAQLLFSWRRWRKAVNTYYQPYLNFSDSRGRVHPNFGFTRTGRLTCYDPNLHATPHYSPEYKMKDCWIAPPGHRLVYMDWSQAEMRLCAHYTRNPVLMQAFSEGIDIHDLVAKMLGCDRQTAKPLNYGAAYGMGPARLAREYGMPEHEAKRWLQAYHETLPAPRALYRRMEALAQSRGWIRLWDGRYRRFSRDPRYRALPHSASNSLLQGGVGAMARRKMLALAPWIYEQGGQLWLQIHDAILLTLPEDRVTPEAFRYLRAVMEDFPFAVPMKVDIGHGKSWREATENKVYE